MNKFLLSLCFVLTLSNGLMAMKFDDSEVDIGFQLVKAAMNGNYVKAKKLLEDGAPVDTQNFLCYTGLLIAAERGFESICKLLLEHKAQVNQKNPGGATPLAIAAGRGTDGQGNLDICKLLVAHKAQVDSENKQGLTPLTQAIFLRHQDIGTFLIDEMLKPIQGDRKKIVTLLGIKKFRAPECLNLIGKDVITFIAQHYLYPRAEQSQCKIVAQINRGVGDWDQFRADLMDYYRKNLNSDPKVQLEDSHE